jgi:hypothetical protein
MRAPRLVAAALALVLGGLVLLLAADVSRWRETMRADDLQYSPGTGAAPDWRVGSQIVPFGLAGRLLGVDDDAALRRAVLAYRSVTRSHPLDPGTARRARSEAEVALANVAAESSGAQASQAADLLGILAFADSTSGGAVGRSSPVERSLTAFENAVRLDRDNNAAAKYNLELVLRLLRARGQRPGGTPSAGTRGGGRRGAGGGTPGRGY